MSDGPASFRCTVCALNHEPIDCWTECCQCGGDTSPMAYAQPNITHEEAKSIKNHRLFDTYLEETGRA